MRLPKLLPAAALALVTFGTAAPGGGREQALAPRLLSQTGLYEDLKSLKVRAENLAYSPQYPLWSDGADKLRWIHLPRGGRIEAGNPDAWEFPVGTKFWKEFSFNQRKVETRLLWRTSAASWTYATYLWRKDQSDALLASSDGEKDYLEIAPGKSHSIPSVQDCKTCHQNGGPEVLGFTALQLSPDRDPLAPHAELLQAGMVNLATLLEAGILANPPAHTLAPPPRIPAANPRSRAVAGYLAANCGTCHPGNGPLQKLGLDLKHRSAVTAEAGMPWYTTAYDVAGKTSMPKAPAGEARRIKPGSPELSTLVYRMASRKPSSQMPPLGSVLVDEQALELIRKWIAEDLAKR